MPPDHKSAAATLAAPPSPRNSSSSVRDHHRHHPPPTLMRRSNSNSNSNSNAPALGSPVTPAPDALPPWARQAAATPPAPSSPLRSSPSLYHAPTSSPPSSGPNATGSSFRLNRHRHRRVQKKPLQRRLLAQAAALSVRARRTFLSLSLLQRALAVAGGAVVLVAGVLGVAFSHRILATVGLAAHSWRDALGPFFGRLVVALMICTTAFPPILGYSWSVTLCGVLYGFPGGWPVAAAATVVGSWAAFRASRGFLGPMVERRVGQDTRFRALAHVLRRDGVGVLAMIRFCPLPYSLSNGFLATIPTVRPGPFALATALSSPKLLVHVFIGSRVALLAESGDKMSMGDRLVNFASMGVGGLLGVGIGLYIFRRTMARAAELALEEGDEDAERAALAATGEGDDHDHDDDHDDDEYDEEARLVRAAGGDPDAAAVLMDPDDISLWNHDMPAEQLEEAGGRDASEHANGQDVMIGAAMANGYVKKNGNGVYGLE